MSYSDWTDRVAASSFAGDVMVTSFDSSYHLSISHKNIIAGKPDQHKVSVSYSLQFLIVGVSVTRCTTMSCIVCMSEK